MANPTRYTKIGLSGGSVSSNNLNDPYIQTVEFPVVAVASASAQSTTVKAPTQSMQVISSYLTVKTAEATATVKTVDVSITGTTAGIQNDTSVAATGAKGTPLLVAIDSSPTAVFTYTLAGADFVELDAVCVVTFQGIDA